MIYTILLLAAQVKGVIVTENHPVYDSRGRNIGTNGVEIHGDVVCQMVSNRNRATIAIGGVKVSFDCPSSTNDGSDGILTYNPNARDYWRVKETTGKLLERTDHVCTCDE